MEQLIGIYNIPKDFDSFSLREFFSKDINNKESFKLFHYKNRPEESFRRILKEKFSSAELTADIEQQPYQDSNENEDAENCQNRNRFNNKYNVFNYSTLQNELVQNEEENKPSPKEQKTFNMRGTFTIIHSSFDIIQNYDGKYWDENRKNLGKCNVIILSEGKQLPSSS